MSRYQGKRILIVGLGLSGVSALRYLARQGADLVVTDSRPAPKDGALMQAEFPQFAYHFGAFTAPEPLNQFSEAIVSPGVDLREPFIQQLRDAGVPIVGDIELFARHVTHHAKVIGITGSNGKSTVTTLVGEMAKAAGWKVGVGGNLAPPALDVLTDDAQLYVLELSSFQLETTHSLRCAAATILNLSEDHLDRHGTMAEYAAAKARIWNGCALAVVGAEIAAPHSQQVRRFLLTAPEQSGDYGLVEHEGQTWLAVWDIGESQCSRLIPQAALPIKGLHNAANALAALALADAVGIPRAASLEALHRFRGLPHRCVPVATIQGATYYNDSKGTNVGSTLAAIQGLPGPLVWLGGGQGKGQDFAPLARALANKASAAVLFGEDAAAIETAILGAVPVYREATLHHALARASSLAEAGGSVLLSPACASFDQFKSYVDRGQQFEAAVLALAEVRA